MSKVKFIAMFLLAVLALPTAAISEEDQKSDAIKNLEKFGHDERSFVDGNLYFLMYHEMAHALISEFSLPVIGREEDAADRLATLLMTPDSKEQEPEYLLGAIQGWFAIANETPLNEIAWWDEHGTDRQRGFQIGCLLYGAEPARYQKLAKLIDLPEDRRETCELESKQNKGSWDSLLEPNLVEEGGAKTAGTIKVEYAPTKEYMAERDYLRELGVLEDIASDMQTYYKFRPEIVVEAKECGQANAFWDGEERKMTLCYELVADFQRLTQK
jgi:Putative metallopeptidase